MVYRDVQPTMDRRGLLCLSVSKKAEPLRDNFIILGIATWNNEHRILDVASITGKNDDFDKKSIDKVKDLVSSQLFRPQLFHR